MGLQWLLCSNNNLKTLDISECPALTLLQYKSGALLSTPEVVGREKCPSLRELSETDNRCLPATEEDWGK